MKYCLLSFLLMIGLSLKADTACVGFTGNVCDRSYPFTERGLVCAMRDTINGTVRFGPGIISMWGDRCYDEDWRVYLMDGGNFLILPQLRQHWTLGSSPSFPHPYYGFGAILNRNTSLIGGNVVLQ